MPRKLLEERSTGSATKWLREEEKIEKKSRADQLKIKFMQTRDNSDINSIFSEPPSEFSVLCDDDDCDKGSVVSSTLTTSIRKTFSSFRFDENQRKKGTRKRRSSEVDSKEKS
ncbi:uncharacterized protein CELE_C02B8.1 [Caenorhabditis elegans]|uniref:Uncharacterized protein C02B8.1 n=1 Tax=Caenorhabditis elegans TaxID=6239 RepID=YWZ1_CAEEL|nr:Uncharacterized protein CELE_C02B8.1 [Caenorhabditis elegans]Q11091.2 RecName: Full=Uncharacterized protein C02B8.1 [Caenorhabditis elegans]CCD62503.1 Uncharacterized protein CELE_C02B8.1 [Caenorhabditis elegans]|eukprot:NP_509373.2 Uncharacterized protein CELE_C02B8.1 [Caenorhabditis elegans]